MVSCCRAGGCGCCQITLEAGEVEYSEQADVDVVLDLMGIIPRDQNIVKAVQKQRALLQTYPASPAAIEFKKIAEAADKWPRAKLGSGKLEFFLERIIEEQAGVRS